MKFFVITFIIYFYFHCILAEEGKNIPSVLISCTHDDHCGDFRMICSKKEICLCSRFYDWDDELQQCHLNLSEIGLWLDSMREERDFRAELDNEAEGVFLQLGLAGLSAILLGLFGGLACVYCFCFQKGYNASNSTAVIIPTTKEDKKNIAEGDAGISEVMFI